LKKWILIFKLKLKLIKDILLNVVIILSTLVMIISCENTEEADMKDQISIIFMHNSAGKRIWRDDLSKIADKPGFNGDVNKWSDDYNKNDNKIYKES